MMTVTDALNLILGDIKPLDAVSTSLSAALGRVLAEDLVASLNLPPFPNSGMDGFAVRSADLNGAGPFNPVRLGLMGESRAGDQPSSLPPGRNCLRIMTGAPLPLGADAVVMKEDIVEEPVGFIRFSEAITPGLNVRTQGQDIARGQKALATGTLLRSAEIAMAAALGCGEVLAIPRPRIAIFSTGDELVPPGTPLAPGQIYNSNGPMLEALARSANFEVGLSRHLPDDLDCTMAEIKNAALSHDAVICSGGVSVGEHDHVRTSIERLGVIRFWRVAMKPGKPLVYGSVKGCPLFGLPGNPVSSMVSFELFVRPALLRMAGQERVHRPQVRARLLAPLSHRPGREEYARVMTTCQGDEFVTRPSGLQGSHHLSSMIHANSLAVIPPEAGSLPAGARVDVLMTEWPEE